MPPQSPTPRLSTPADPGSLDVERVDWKTFQRRFRWKQGEHVLVAGPTESGKTTVALWLLEQRNWVVVLGLKPADPVLSELQRKGWDRITRWPPPPKYTRDGRRAPQHVLLWPVTRKADNKPRAKAAINDALKQIFEKDGNWTVYVDELAFAAPKWYDFEEELERQWGQGRTLGISLIVSTQRPAGIPRLAVSQITHMFVFCNPDKRDCETISEIGGLDRRQTIDLISGLPRFDFFYRNTRDRVSMISRAPKRA